MNESPRMNENQKVKASWQVHSAKANEQVVIVQTKLRWICIDHRLPDITGTKSDVS